MIQATDFFKLLGSENVFKPKALAVVSHNDKSFVGASIAVSNFPRPLYMHQVIADIKNPSLREAIIFHKPLQTEDTRDWTSVAIQVGKEGAKKPACTNCRNTFNGFVPKTEQQIGGKNRSFLGVCAEFCTVDKLLHDETNASDGEKIGKRLRGNFKPMFNTL